MKLQCGECLQGYLQPMETPGKHRCPSCGWEGQVFIADEKLSEKLKDLISKSAY